MSFLAEQQDKANKNLENVTIQSRAEDRALWERLITVILGVLGFSLTLFSTDFLSSRIIESWSKYLLLSSWILYALSLFVGFFLLKIESIFQRKESLRNTFYAMDTSELLDGKTLKVLEGKKGPYIALQVLRGKSIGPNDYWSEEALALYEKHKTELTSYKLAGNPDDLYSTTDRMLVAWSERLFYGIIVLATVSLIASVVQTII